MGFADYMESESGVNSVSDLTQQLLVWVQPLLGLKHLGTGRHRTTYRLNETTVWKFPLSADGCFDNLREAKVYQDTNGVDGEFRYAACSVFPLCGLAILEMEYVEPKWSTRLPKWTGWIDCQQVGYNRNGILVAYDYAD